MPVYAGDPNKSSLVYLSTYSRFAEQPAKKRQKQGNKQVGI